MKTWTTLLCVVLAVAFATGVALAAEKGAAKAENPTAKGKVKEVAADSKSITVTVGEKEETFAVNAETKVMQGTEAKTVADVKAGERVTVSYKEADGAKTALVIHIAAEKHAK